MIKIVAIRPPAYPELELSFNDGMKGAWSAAHLIECETVLTRPLVDEHYFGRVFIESGALA